MLKSIGASTLNPENYIWLLDNPGSSLAGLTSFFSKLITFLILLIKLQKVQFLINE